MVAGAHQRSIGTRTGRRAGSVHDQAKLVLRWFRDDAPLRQLATEAGIGISTAYRYLHEGIDVLAEQAADLHEVLKRGRQEGWSHVSLDGTLIEIDRVAARKENGHHLWYSGKHKTQGGNVQVLADPSGFQSAGLPTLTDKGYQGARIGVYSPVKGHNLHVSNASYNMLLTAVRALGERANAELKQRWKCLRRIPLPQSNRRHRRRRNRPINPATRKLLRKPQYTDD